MTPEAVNEGTLPKDALAEIASDLFNKSIFTLSENEGFRKAIVAQFLKSPQGMDWITWKQTKLNFESQGSKYRLNITRVPYLDRIILSTENEGVIEMIDIRSSEVTEDIVMYSRFDHNSEEPVKSDVNSSEAVQKVRRFLHQI